jgi:hypothetical protein
MLRGTIVAEGARCRENRRGISVFPVQLLLREGKQAYTFFDGGDVVVPFGKAWTTSRRFNATQDTLASCGPGFAFPDREFGDSCAEARI